MATPTSAPPSVSLSAATVQDSASPSQVIPPVSSIPSLASEEGLKSLVHSVLASFLSQPTLSLGSNCLLQLPQPRCLTYPLLDLLGGARTITL